MGLKDWDYSKTWYHGSPLDLTVLRKGSTITQDRDLARVFSHKPSIVAWSDKGFLGHNGKKRGFLYCIAEDINADDVYPHPNSSMKDGAEWLTSRELRLSLIYKTEILEKEKLSQEDVVKLKKQLEKAKSEKN